MGSGVLGQFLVSQVYPPPLHAGDTRGLAKWVGPDDIQETTFHARELGDHSYPPHDKVQDQINHLLCACARALTLSLSHIHTRTPHLQGQWEAKTGRRLGRTADTSPSISHIPQIVFHLIINSDSNPCLESNFFFFFEGDCHGRWICGRHRSYKHFINLKKLIQVEDK